MKWITRGWEQAICRFLALASAAPLGGYDYGPICEEDAIQAVQEALEQGINFFDVADVYGFGRAEELLAKALGPRRHDVVLATKVGLRFDGGKGVRRDGSPQWILKAVDDSLRRLQVDTIPLCQLHWLDPETPWEESLLGLEQCQRAGKVRVLGVSNVDLQQLQRLCEHWTIASVQVAYNLLCRDVENDLVPWCQQNQISVLAHSGLARGFLAGKHASGRFVGSDTRRRSAYFSETGTAEKEALLEVLHDVGRPHAISSAAVAIQWLLRNPGICSALVGAKTRTQLLEITQSCREGMEASAYRRLTIASSQCAGGADRRISKEVIS